MCIRFPSFGNHCEFGGVETIILVMGELQGNVDAYVRIKKDQWCQYAPKGLSMTLPIVSPRFKRLANFSISATVP